jgi:hypothetical protein
VQSSRGWPSLGEALEASYAAARQAVRASNGIRVLLMLLQVSWLVCRTRSVNICVLQGCGVLLATVAPCHSCSNRETCYMVTETLADASEAEGGLSHKLRHTVTAVQQLTGSLSTIVLK